MLPEKFIGGTYFKPNKFSYQACPVMTINKKDHYFLFDYRIFNSLTTAEINKRSITPKYRIRHELVVDIQASFSNHVNRFGVTYVE
jgi:hypothetical protein